MIGSPPQPTLLQVEPGTSRDLDGVMDVMRVAFGDRYGEAWTRSQCAGILPMSGVSLVIARNGSSTVGFSLSRTVAGEAELLLIGVAPDHHRRGIGRRLLDDFIARARNEGVERVHLEVRDGNRAMTMYQKAGFEPVGRRSRYYLGSDGVRHDAITLARDL